jgi:anhydro-N-acetylmuramic acid kinase
MSTINYLNAIGIMTGNSLDAVDVVLTKFGEDGSIVDLDAFSKPITDDLANQLRSLREVSVECESDMKRVEQVFNERFSGKNSLSQIIRQYTLCVAETVKVLIDRAKSRQLPVDIIGFHGQTCAHQPPSIAKSADSAYTLQIGDGQLLADETGITVVYDFRSDDLMNGGEAAPLAPAHHQHLANHLRSRGTFPIAFCNAGNTGNISVISEEAGGLTKVMGWDVGPFNNYPDKLMQKQKGESCDADGLIGASGRVNLELLRNLFERGAVTEKGDNFLLQPPPKSSDPQWYKLTPELLGESALSNHVLSFEERLRTAEYFSAYIYAYSLRWIPTQITLPRVFALCGGGWNNPVCRSHFEDLLRGRFDSSPILPEHQDTFQEIAQRLNGQTNRDVEVATSDQYGFSGQFMEARIFADAAVCRIQGQPFTIPETSGCKSPTVLGIIRYPNKKKELASERLKQWFTRYKSSDLTLDKPELFDGRWSRASRGWDRHKIDDVSRKL